MYHSDSRDRKPVKRNNQYSFRALRSVCLFVFFLEGGGGGRVRTIIKFLYLQGGCSFEVGRLIEPTLNEQK